MRSITQQPRLLAKMPTGPHQLRLSFGTARFNVRVEPLFKSIRTAPGLGAVAAPQWHLVTAAADDEVNVKALLVADAAGVHPQAELGGELTQSDIQAFERDPEDRWSREPALPHLLCIARLAGVTIDMLVDPKQELPERLPPDPMHGVVRRTPKKPAKKSSEKQADRQRTK